jgi:hypothetical protein
MNFYRKYPWEDIEKRKDGNIEVLRAGILLADPGTAGVFVAEYGWEILTPHKVSTQDGFGTYESVFEDLVQELQRRLQKDGEHGTMTHEATSPGEKREAKPAS